MRTRIIGVAVLASVLAILLFGVPLGAAVHRYAMQQERVHLVAVASDVAIRVAGDMDDKGTADRRDLQGLGADGDRIAGAVYGTGGELVAGSVAGNHTRILNRALDGDVRSGTDAVNLLAAVPVTHSDEVIGVVLVASPRSAVLGWVAIVWTAMAGLAVLAVASAGLVGRWQARGLAAPLEQLEDRARRLGDGDFSVRSRRGGVTEIDSVGAAMDATAIRLDDLLARERAFSADVSHQLRNPLAGLRLRLEEALERPDEDLRPAVTASLAAADRLQSTIDELLSLARAGQAGPAGALDLAAVLGESAPEWEARLTLSGRDLKVLTEPDAPQAWASGAAVRQVLAVLVDNAATHGAGTVTISVREASGALAVDVADEGRGLNEPASVLFARPADRCDGHGIGLALARRLAEAEQGRLEVTRRAPPVFSLLLPSAESHEERAVSAAAQLSA